MRIKINGKNEEIKDLKDLAELVKGKKLEAGKIVLEHNLKVIPKNKWKDVTLKEDDNIEIVSFVGGG